MCLEAAGQRRDALLRRPRYTPLAEDETCVKQKKRERCRGGRSLSPSRGSKVKAFRSRDFKLLPDPHSLPPYPLPN